MKTPDLQFALLGMCNYKFQTSRSLMVNSVTLGPLIFTLFKALRSASLRVKCYILGCCEINYNLIHKCVNYRSIDSLSTDNLVGGGGGAPDQICGRLSSDKVTLAVGGEVALSNGTSVASPKKSGFEAKKDKFAFISCPRNLALKPQKTNLPP